jgi:Effector protein
MADRISGDKSGTNYTAHYNAPEPREQSSATRGNPSRQQVPASLQGLSQKTDTPTRWNGVVIRTKPSDSKSFAEQANEALGTIASKPVGAQLLNSIAQSGGQHGGAPASFGYKVCIQPADSTKTKRLLGSTRKYHSSNVTRAASDDHASTPGRGSVSSVKWNPDQNQTPDGSRPPFIGLAHELEHARRNLYGNSHLTPASVGPGESYRRVDEHQVVGLAPYAGLPITENKIRAEHGIPLRKQYSGLDE